MYNALGVPETNHKLKPGEAPPAQEDPRFKMWEHLLEDNFVASINLQLQVTNSEGLNPSVSLPTPFNPLPTAGLGTPTPFVGNFTLAVSGQLDGSQYRSFSLAFFVDMARLYKLLEIDPRDSLGNPIPSLSVALNEDKTVKEISHIRGANHIVGPAPDHSADRIVFDCNFGKTLSGDLGFEEILESGLSAIDRISLVNIYSGQPSSDMASPRIAEGPTPAPGEKRIAGVPNKAMDEQQFPQSKIGGRSEATQQLTEIVTQLSGINKSFQAITDNLKLIEGNTLKVGNGSTPTQPPTTIGSTVQFTVTEGVNGGPNWTMTHFSGPTGSSGGGGSGGGKGGGGSGGGGSSGGGGGAGGGGASQGFINFNRNAVDSVTFLAAATCHIDPEDAKDPSLSSLHPKQPAEVSKPLPDGSYWETIPTCKGPQGQLARAATLQLFQLQNSFRVP
jgi:hypothetical protein